MSTILILCTGNVCRSPYFELRLKQELRSRGGTYDLDIYSAGTHALVGQSVEPVVATLLEQRSVDPASHLARQITTDLATSADLVLTATRNQRSWLVTSIPSLLNRTFGIADFTHVLQQARGSDLPTSHSPGERAVDMRDLVLRLRSQVAPLTSAYDITDPYLRAPAAARRMAGQLEAALSSLTLALLPAT